MSTDKLEDYLCGHLLDELHTELRRAAVTGRAAYLMLCTRDPARATVGTIPLDRAREVFGGVPEEHLVAPCADAVASIIRVCLCGAQGGVLEQVAWWPRAEVLA